MLDMYGHNTSTVLLHIYAYRLSLVCVCGKHVYIQYVRACTYCIYMCIPFGCYIRTYISTDYVASFNFSSVFHIFTSVNFPQSLGQVGRVVKVFPTGDVRVVVNTRTWTYNPQCLQYAPAEELPKMQCK